TRESPLRFGDDMPLRAGLLTSLGFGHVAGLIAVAHPEAFVAALPEGRRDAYRARAAARQVAGARRLARAMAGGAGLYERPEGRRFDGLGCSATGKVSVKEHEAAMLLEPRARLNPEGEYRLDGQG